MRHRVLVATFIGIALSLGAIPNSAYADSRIANNRFLNVSEFEGHIVFCAPQNPPVSVVELPGGIEIVTFVNIGNIWLTGNPLVDGVEENKAVATFDPASPNFTVRIRSKVDVAAVDGIWRIRQRLSAGPDGDSGFGLGFGSGDLRGKFLVFETGTPGMIENSPCEVPFGAPVRGKVISFGWTG